MGDCDALQGPVLWTHSRDKGFVDMVLWSPAERDSANPTDSQCVRLWCWFCLLNILLPGKKQNTSTSLLDQQDEQVPERGKTQRGKEQKMLMTVYAWLVFQRYRVVWWSHRGSTYVKPVQPSTHTALEQTVFLGARKLCVNNECHCLTGLD